MSKITAQQIVTNLLEYGATDDWQPQPNEHEWLRGKNLLTPLSKDASFTGQRPGEEAITNMTTCPHCNLEFDYSALPEIAMGAVACPGCEETVSKQADQPSALSKMTAPSRFQWKPPTTESSNRWSDDPEMSSVDSGMGGGELPLRREAGTYQYSGLPSKGSMPSDPEAMIQRDPLWRDRTASFPDTLSLMKAYLADPNGNPQIKHSLQRMLPKD